MTTSLKSTTVTGTGAVAIATGTTAQRPVSPTVGSIRYNTNLKYTELYNGTSWEETVPNRSFYNSAGNGGPAIIADNGPYRTHTYMVRPVYVDYSESNSGAINDATYKVLKTFTVSHTGTISLRFSGYIQSGSYYWAYRIRKNSTTTVVNAGFGSNIIDGTGGYVHAYNHYRLMSIDVTAGDTITIEAGTTGGDNTSSVTGNGQTIYIKDVTVNYTGYTFTPSISGNVEVLLVAGGGGGGGGGYGGGGGGAGGLIYNPSFSVVAGTTYNISVGDGGWGGRYGGVNTGFIGASGEHTIFGNNLITNGTFTTDTTGWTAYNSSLGISSNRLAITRSGGGGLTAYQTFTTVIGNSYTAIANINASGSMSDFRIINGTDPTASAIVTSTSVTAGKNEPRLVTFTATGTTSMILFTVDSNATSVYVDNVGVYDNSLSLVTVGGGYGGAYTGSANPGASGGSGGGGGATSVSSAPGTGIVGQGFAGGIGNGAAQDFGGGGGGAGGYGLDGASGRGGDGGNGLVYDISGVPTWYAGGGGGGCYAIYSGAPGAGGGGAATLANAQLPAQRGAFGTGGGGGGGSNGATAGSNGGDGGSGVAIIRYLNMSPATVSQKFENIGTSTWYCPAGVTRVDVLVVAGGGGGGHGTSGGGGGGGGLVYNSGYTVTPGQAYTVVVGAGGTGTNADGTMATNGGNSQFDNITASGGGYGGNENATASNRNGNGGGSGGGGAYNGTGTAGTVGQGNSGGNGTSGTNGSVSVWIGGGGGGAGSAGQSASMHERSITGGTTQARAGNGGNGQLYGISGTATWYAGGGGGATQNNSSVPPVAPGFGGLGGGGDGAGDPTTTTLCTGQSGINGTGGGGGGGPDNGGSGNGGSGIVILRWVP